MITRTKITFLVPLVLITLIITNLKAEEKIEAVIDQIQIISKDLKTLEKAVYSGSENIKTRNISSNNFLASSSDHLFCDAIWLKNNVIV